MKLHRYFVYILECSDGSYYTGVTNNLERRFGEHENGHDPKAYTFKRRPLKLAYQKEFQYILEAIAFEKQVKGWTRAKKEALIKSETESLSSLSKCLNSTSHENYGKRGE